MQKKTDKPKMILPKSPTSMTINWIAVFVFIYSLSQIKNFNLSEVEAAVLSMLALALPIILLEYVFLKTYSRPSTGLNFKIRNTIDLKRVTIGVTGLYGTIGFVALVYWLFPVYNSDPFFDNYWIFAKYVAVILLAGGIPYFIVLDKFMVEPRDSYWHFGMFILGQWKKADIKTVRQHILGWTVKLFFLPLMFSYLINNLNFIKTMDFSEAKQYFPYMYDYLYNLIFTVDLAFVSVGYLMTMKIFDSQIRTAEPTILGWIVALQCYQPFWGFSSGNYLRYDDDYHWVHLFNENELLYTFWGVSILILLFIYVWASIVFGLRFSNLTNRGILTNGPYRFCMHPAYVSKNLSWWLVSIPFISQAGPWEAIRHSALLLLLNIIYYIRAVTEERHLSQDPNYVKYGLAMNKLSVFRKLFRIFPFLKYNPEKYLGQLEDYSSFTVPKSAAVRERVNN
ncbi:MAG: isoprenylcysteine carboxyl methyltransferase [Bacteroidetes bacterium]|nr:isoprenylcysteine carboxyl methyltransferase [Bacteroidota bacterium]